MEDYFKKLEQTLNNLKNPVNLWWRDDDVRAKYIPFYHVKEKIDYIKYKKTLTSIIKLLNKHHIPPIFAVIPENYLENGSFFTALLKKHNVFVMLHGLTHLKKATNTPIKSEFPEYRKEDYIAIMHFYDKFKQLFGDHLLNVFCPPYNHINPTLEKKLNETGLVISSANDSQNTHSIYNVDYDFCDWSKYKVKPKETIINELCTLLESGHTTIGINSHHVRLEDEDFIFFDKLFAIMEKSGKIHWINPFQNNTAFTKIE